MRNRRRTSAAASTYSDEYRGPDIATHSPQPSASPVTALRSRMSRVVVIVISLAGLTPLVIELRRRRAW